MKFPQYIPMPRLVIQQFAMEAMAHGFTEALVRWFTEPTPHADVLVREENYSNEVSKDIWR